MKLSQFLLLNAGLLTQTLAACPGRGLEPKGHEYQRLPGANRSPCPGLNALANHGFLPRSGKSIDLPTLRSAVAAAYHYESTAFDMPFNIALSLNISTTGNASTFHLADLAAHDAVEFDGSLSRNDFDVTGDDNHFDPAVWGSVARSLGLYDNGGEGLVTVEVAAKARAARVRDAMAVNKGFNASENQMNGSPGTTALYLTTLWDAEKDGAPKKWVRAFFEEERIPFREGYNPVTEKKGTDIGVMFGRVVAVETD